MFLKLLKPIYVILLLSMPIIGFSQSFLGTLNFGGNLAQVDGDEVVGFKKIGFNVGVCAMLPIYKNKFFTSVELSFSQKGAYERLPLEADPTKSLPYYNLRLNYLDVPLLVHFYDKQTVMIGAGVIYSRLVGLKEIEWGVKTSSSIANKTYATDNFTLAIDIRLPIYKKLKFNFRYNYSLNSIRKRHFIDSSGKEWDRYQYNNYLSFRVIYVFNEPTKSETQGN